MSFMDGPPTNVLYGILVRISLLRYVVYLYYVV